MRIKPFRIENYFAKYEFSAQYLLASSDVESQTIRDVLDLEPGAHEEFLKQWCGYTEVSGAPQLREVIAGIYTRIKSDDVVVLSFVLLGLSPSAVEEPEAQSIRSRWNSSVRNLTGKCTNLIFIVL